MLRQIMRIGSLKSSQPQASSEQPRSEKKAPTRGKPVSADEIRAKVAASKSQAPSKLKLGEKTGFSRYENDSDKGIVPDVGLNDPNDPATRGKLKDLLSKGAINFNDRERNVLDKILREDS